jgi:prepilin-type N-terminal cleavage/methylation domain-containing protein
MARDRGLTLAELMVAVAVMAILGGVSAPYLLASLPGYRVNGAARQLVADIRLSRTLAIERGVDTFLEFDSPRGSYKLALDTDGAAGLTVDDERLKTVNLYHLYPGIQLSRSQPGSPVTFSGGVAVFKPRGTSNGGAVYLKPTKDTGTRTDRERKVTVTSTTGRARAYRRNGTGWE